ncbi:PEP-utilizing enzyme [Andreprevotia chitinilytica]|uniref:PEP-utilizing enzyme n=1 Tax=Andreprevotia chitinilytica TaxID=396808 RepID=UPI0005569F8B|nr:PEP-utilizing enzyme [Andreprevotia chitinilytica]
MTSPTLYLLGGNGSCAEWWQDALSSFQHYQPEPVELPGFGNNPQPPCSSIAELADALLAQTQPGQAIYGVGVNSLVVLHALVKQPRHFSRVILQSPVGAFLWERRLPKIMGWRPLRALAHWLVGHYPQRFHRKFSTQRWTTAQYARMGDGYRRCRAFEPYWDIMRADAALTLFDRIETPIELIWGQHDGVIPWEQAAAWEGVLCRAELSVTLQPDWGHYPWIDDPAGFASWVEAPAPGFAAHTKAGRLQLAEVAGLPVPARLTPQSAIDPRLARLLAAHPAATWAVRSSSFMEDKIDHANAGLTRTFLRVTAADVPARVTELLADGVEEVVVQCFIEPTVSGIAFARHVAAEVEWVDGHLEALADGHVVPHRAVLSRIGGAWEVSDFPATQGLTRQALWAFLQAVVRTFHYAHLDIEWAWDGQALHLLQARPVTTYPWRRHLTAANIGEILPPAPSRLVEYAQRRAAASIPAIWARWDGRVLADNEPFTALAGDASYINNDLFLARLADWGLPSTQYAAEVGGAAPALPFRPGRLLRNAPTLLSMLYQSRRALAELEPGLRRFDAELRQLIAGGADGQTLADWFTRFYVFVVQGNLCIGAAISTAGGGWLGQRATAYQALADAPHRVPYETDPASPRTSGADLPIQPFPVWPAAIRLAHHAGLPGLRGYYTEVREWYRDNLMRVFYRLHHAVPAEGRAHWFAPHTSPREHSGSFWQDGSGQTAQDFGFVIVPGSAEGIVGVDILLVDTLDPGQYTSYRAAKAVIARSGGKLSHGSTLLRELGKPSAIAPDTDPSWLGRAARYCDGRLEATET